MQRGKLQPFQTLCVLLVVATIIATSSTQALAQISDPRDISGNVLWLDASDVDGNFVSGGSFLNGTTWVDKSTALNASASQSDNAARPTVSQSNFNKLTIVEFDGDDFMDASDSAAFEMLRNVQGATMIGLLATDQPSSARGMRALMVSSGSNAAATRAGINLYDGFGQSIGGTGDFGLAGRRLDSDGFQRIEGGTVVQGELATMTGLFDYQSGELALRVNGLEQTRVNTFQTPGATSDTASLNIRLGADAGALRGFFTGQIAELIVYDRVLTAAELASVESYLAAKWTQSNAVLLGDINLDSTVSFLDIAPFITILSTNGFQSEADTNQDDTVNFQDIAPFIEILSGS